MVNEVLMVGTLWVKIEVRQTKNGNLLTHMQIERADIIDSTRVFRTYIPIVGFSKAADKLLTFNHSDLFIARGKITWSSEQGGLIVACHDVSKFAMPGAEEVEPNAAA